MAGVKCIQRKEFLQTHLTQQTYVHCMDTAVQLSQKLIKFHTFLSLSTLLVYIYHLPFGYMDNGLEGRGRDVLLDIYVCQHSSPFSRKLTGKSVEGEQLETMQEVSGSDI